MHLAESPTQAKNRAKTKNSDSLGNYTSFASHDTLERKTNRYQLQNQFIKIDPESRVKVCQRYIIPNASHVDIKRSHDSANFSGLMSCENVHTCPHCMSRINATRAKALKNALIGVESLGYGVYLMTLTLKHIKRDKLAYLLEGLTKAYRYMFSGKTGIELKNAMAWVGSSRALEIRYGKNGFHPHFHIVILTDTPHSAESLSALAKTLKNRWIQALNHFGYDASEKNGLDLRETYLDICGYLTKQSNLALELTSHETKSESDSLSMLEILDASIENPRYESIWYEYTQAIKSHKSLVMCGHFREIAEYESHLSDAESTDADADADADIIASIPRSIWHAIKQHKTDIRSDCLHMAFYGGYIALAEYLHAELGLSYGDCLQIAPRDKIPKNIELAF